MADRVRYVSNLILPLRLREGRELIGPRKQKGFIINPYAFGNAGADPNYSNVTSLLHMEGANGGTTFTDEKSITWDRFAGLPTTSTAQFKFGSSSMSGSFIRGTNALGVGGFGTGNFTIEGWFYATSTTTRGLFDALAGSTSATIAAGWDQSTTHWQVYFSGTVYSSANTSITLNTWQHFALVRNGTACVLYIGGVALVSFTSAANVTFPDLRYALYYNSSFPWVGYMDECRVTRGVARYTAAFTPPTAAFPSF